MAFALTVTFLSVPDTTVTDSCANSTFSVHGSNLANPTSYGDDSPLNQILSFVAKFSSSTEMSALFLSPSPLTQLLIMKFSMENGNSMKKVIQ